VVEGAWRAVLVVPPTITTTGSKEALVLISLVIAPRVRAYILLPVPLPIFPA